MNIPASHSAGLLGLSLFHASLGMAILLEQSFSELELLRLPMSQLLVPTITPVILILLLMETGAYLWTAIWLGLCAMWSIGYLIWANMHLISLTLSFAVAEVLIALQIFFLFAVMYLLFPVFDTSVYARFSTQKATKTLTSFNPSLYWTTLWCGVIVLQLRLALASWFPTLNTHLLLFFCILTPGVQVVALLKQRDSLGGLQMLFAFLFAAEVVYSLQVAFFWLGVWPSVAAIVASGCSALGLVIMCWNLEMLKQVPFANRLAQLL